ncbi:hypothetical protein MMC19_004902 [Ptychographa xylographoides]|nr:hypothetical protein [Ptychographa xylographoides]
MVSVNLGSLRSDSLSTLAEAGILPSAQNTEEHAGPGGADKTVDRRAVGHEIHGEPWFEEILEGSALGRMRRRRGGKTSADGRARVEWEIVDFEGDEHGESTEGLGTGKRKLEDSTVGEDLVMREGH